MFANPLRMPGRSLPRPGPRTLVTRAAAFAFAIAMSVMAVTGGGCRQGKRPLTRPAAALDAALRPAAFASALRKLGRAHYHGTSRFVAGVATSKKADSVTTDTDIWSDDHGNWRLVEVNDTDGGREVVLHGRELAVALRYGKMIRREAEDPEPEELLEEGLGAAWTGWDLLRDCVTVDDFGDEKREGRQAHIFKVAKSSKAPSPADKVDPADRRSWRATLIVDYVEGTVAVDEGSHIPLAIELVASYRMRRADAPLHGELSVKANIDQIGSSPLIVKPEAEDLVPRQRTVSEVKSLLGGLPRVPARRGQ